MKGFVLGLVVAALAFAGYLYVNRTQPTARPVAIQKADAGVVAKKSKRKRSRGATRLARGGPQETPSGGPAVGQPVAAEQPVAAAPEPEPIRLSASDLKIVGQGDDLSRPDVLRLDMSNTAEARELTQDEIDEKFRAEEGALLDCILP